MAGKLTVVCGPMFAKKTSWLLSHANMLVETKNMDVVLVKTVIDTRYSIDPEIVTHDNLSSKTLGLTTILYERVKLAELKTHEVVIFDEAQFMTGLPTIVKVLLENQTDVVCVGLDLSSAGNTFGPMGDLLAMADEVVKLTSTCHCGKPATRTRRKDELGEEGDHLSHFRPSLNKFQSTLMKTVTMVDVGGEDKYEPVCLEHWNFWNGPQVTFNSDTANEG